MQIYQNEFMTLNYVSGSGVLELVWNGTTSKMQDYDFKGCLYTYAGYAIEHQARNLLILIQNFGYGGAMSGELTEWRNHQIFPKYNAAGVEKMAFWGNAEQLPPQDPPQSELANFQTRFFSEKEEIDRWFAG